MAWFDSILYPLQWVVAWILAISHDIFTSLGMDPSDGWTWLASIACLTIVIRSILIPLFVYQIKSMRRMQFLQPDIQRLQAKYKGKKDQFSRQAMAEEQLALFRKHKTNPLASCFPILVQLPIFLSLFRVIEHTQGIAHGSIKPIGGLTQKLAQSMDSATIWGIPLQADFTSDGLDVKILTVVLILVMAISMFITQRQMFTKNMSEAALNNPIMKQQKLLLYGMPIIFGVGGFYFPVGVLFYWLVTNFWTMGQQFLVIRNMPSPGSQAEKALMERRAKKGKSPLPGQKPVTEETRTPAKTGGQRQQPMSKSRQKKKKKKKKS